MRTVGHDKVNNAFLQFSLQTQSDYKISLNILGNSNLETRSWDNEIIPATSCTWSSDTLRQRKVSSCPCTCTMQLRRMENWMYRSTLSVHSVLDNRRIRGDRVGWGTAPQVGRSWVRFPMGFFHWLNPVGRIVALGSTQPLTEMSTRYIYWG